MEIKATKYELAAMAVACARCDCDRCVLGSVCLSDMDSMAPAGYIGIAHYVTVVPDEDEVEA